MRTRTKICGITSPEAAAAAIHAGADALGFVFYPKSKRFITPDAAATIIRNLPPFISKVGLFVNSTRDEIQDTLQRSGIDTLQLHGDESPEFCTGFSQPVIKALRVEGIQTLDALKRYMVSAVLLDAFVAGEHGGTGATFDWEIAREAVAILPSGIILAGGLTPQNVSAAIHKVKPYAVDVSSGVESSPGIKDATRMRQFVEAATNAKS